MLHKAKTLAGYNLDARDGEMGKVEEFYFDDQRWAVRYLVVDAGTWLSGRHVLLSPYCLGAVSDVKKQIVVDLSKQQIEGSPPVDSHKPISRQLHEIYAGYYGWPMYWGGPYMWGDRPTLVRDTKEWKTLSQMETGSDPNLRSSKEVTGYTIAAQDGDIGQVNDFIIDDGNWAIRYLVLDTSSWWSKKQVLVSPKWIDRVSWGEAKVHINLSREAIKTSPEFTDESALSHEYEVALHRHYHREGYWTDEAAEGALYRQIEPKPSDAIIR